MAVPKPTKLGKATRYPGTFSATYDAAANAYRLSLSGFAAVE